MGLVTIPTKVRKDPLGPATLRALVNNDEFLRGAMFREHLVSTGEHNAWEVPRVCRQISGTTVSPSSTDITGVTNPATGKYVLTLAASRFSTDCRLQVNVQGSDAKPYLAGAKVASATSVEVYIQGLTSALGAGNAWAAANQAFDIAIHSEPLDNDNLPPLPTAPLRGLTLDDDITEAGCINPLVYDSAIINAALIAEHTTTAHNVRQVAKKAGLVRFQGGTTYAADGTTDFTSYTRVSAGVVQVDFADVGTAPVSAFACPDWSRVTAAAGVASDSFIVNCVGTSDTRVTVKIYKWDPSGLTWAAADGDFFLAVYCQ
jgi:hypothetical protein